MDRTKGPGTLRRWLAATAVSLCCAAGAAGYPDKPITMVVPQAPGGANDAVARIFAREMAIQLGQPVAVDNRPGAGGNIGTVMAARAAPNGYTVLMTVNSTQAINPLLYKNPGFDPVRDFVAVGAAGSVPNVLLVNPTSKLDSLDALLRQARTKPGQIRYGSAGNGTLPHLMAALLADRAGVELTHVPYKGIGPAITDLLAGQIDMVFATMPAALPHIRGGTLRALSVTSAQRVPSLPEVPALAETFAGYQGVLWIALYAPADTPTSVLEKLAQALAGARRSEAIQHVLTSMGVDLLDEGREPLEKRLAQETVQWGELIKKVRIGID